MKKFGSDIDVSGPQSQSNESLVNQKQPQQQLKVKQRPPSLIPRAVLTEFPQLTVLSESDLSMSELTVFTQDYQLFICNLLNSFSNSDVAQFEQTIKLFWESLDGNRVNLLATGTIVKYVVDCDLYFHSVPLLPFNFASASSY
jgi:hypothetical protein